MFFSRPLTGGATGLAATSPPQVNLDIDLQEGDDRLSVFLAEGTAGGADTAEGEAFIQVFLQGGAGRDVAAFDLPATGGDEMFTVFATGVEVLSGVTNDANSGGTSGQ